MILINLDHWLQQVLAIWLSLSGHVWQQDAFLLAVCLVAGLLLFLTGTVIGLFVQSLWAILGSSRQADEEHQ